MIHVCYSANNYYFKFQIITHNEIQFIKYEKNMKDINDLIKLKKVVYTILLGNYDNVHPIMREKGYDYFMITDQFFEKKTINNWTIINVDKNRKYKNRIDKIKRQRFYKTHPHLFFKNYDLSIYVDATFRIKGNLNEFLIRILTPRLSIYLLEHPNRCKINNEFNSCISLGKDSKNNIIPIKNRYNKEGFPDNNGLAETCLIIRKHNKLNVIRFMESWFNEIKKYSHRDQLSFNYILWKSKDKLVKYISKKIIGKYFKQYKKHLTIYSFKNDSYSYISPFYNRKKTITKYV